MSATAYPTDPSHKHFVVFYCLHNHVRVEKKHVRETKEVCNSIAPGTPNRTKMIRGELKKRGILK